MNWKFFVSMAIGFLSSAGIALEAQDDNDEGSDDLIGEGLVYAASFVKWLLAGRPGSAPAVPTSLAPAPATPATAPTK
jgi:hypothetical protein